ncbi:MAG TPA: hypothetical protein VG817_03660 [Gemmatimonadales bacterium]|nr:hypothetical protein [Gemmatimonadales bacterium]
MFQMIVLRTSLINGSALLASAESRPSRLSHARPGVRESTRTLPVKKLRSKPNG